MEAEDAALAPFTTKQLIAAVKRRQHGLEPFTVDQIDQAVDKLSLAELAELRRRVNSRWDYRISATPGLTLDEEMLYATRDLLGCLRLIRDRTGLGLADAKMLLERWKKGGT